MSEPPSKVPRLENCANGRNYNNEDKLIPVTSTINSNNFQFYLSTVQNLNKDVNCQQKSLRELLSENKCTLIKSIQFNFMIDVNWLVDQYPESDRNKPLILVHSGSIDSDELINKQNITSVRAYLPIPYGTHHTKMMILHYEEGLKVIVTTANLIEQDWGLKTQGIWSSGILTNDQTQDSLSSFKKDLIEYLQSYNNKHIKQWIGLINEYDFSCLGENVYFVASSPGKFSGDNINKFGHLKLNKILSENYKSNIQSQSNLIAQCSSIGSLGSTASNWLLSEFQESLLANDSPHQFNGSSKFHLIYPCVEDVRNSLEGYDAGVSLPYRMNVHNKQKWLSNHLYKWKADINLRSRASPHIKSYYKFSPTFDTIDWFIITSANLSKAAWGAFLKSKKEFLIRSYEVGVLVINKSRAPMSEVFLPFDVPPIKYSNTDEPWCTDENHKDVDIEGKPWIVK